MADDEAGYSVQRKESMMVKRDAAVRGLLLAAVFLVGACADGAPTGPAALDEPGGLFGTIPGDRASFTGTLDHEFVRIAQEIPGFGGLFYDESGTLNVVMAAAGASPSGAELQQRLAARLQAMGQPPQAVQGLRVREGRYDFIELFAMRQRVDQVIWGLRGIVYTDADEAANRVTVGVEDAAAVASAERALTMLGLPQGAVQVRTTPSLGIETPAGAAPPLSNHTLRDRIRPVAGGLALQNSSPFFRTCGLGFNVRSPQAPSVHGFVTHAFCATNHYGTGPVGTMYWQPLEATPESLIGHEAHNAAPFTGGDCPPNPSPDWRGCRWSVAVGARYAAGVPNAFGQIYRTTGIGSFEIDPANPMFQITGEILMSVVGQQVHKVGAGTGWTQGEVDLTCINTGHSWSSPASVGAVTLLCIDRATAGGDPFLDRGSPVFVRAGEHEVQLLGLISNGIPSFIWFSSMGQVRQENPPPPGREWRTH